MKLNISNIGSNNDVFFGCFNDNTGGWYLINPFSTVIKSTLDSSKYEFSGREVYQRPEILKFHKQAGCFEFTTSSLEIYGDESIELERDFKVIEYNIPN